MVNANEVFFERAQSYSAFRYLRHFLNIVKGVIKDQSIATVPGGENDLPTGGAEALRRINQP